MKSVLVLVNTDRNFTPASLMQIYARQATGALFERGRFGEAQLILSALSDNALRPVPRPYRDMVRASLMKHMLLQTIND